MSEEEGKESSKKKKAPLPVVTKTYEERVRAVSVVAHPLASKKSTKKAHKLVKKAVAAKRLRRGVKEVQKALRKGQRGLCILAGDVYPIDVLAHLPVLLEEHNLPYLFVPSKQDLGAAASTKRPTSVVLVSSDQTKGSDEFEGQDLYDSLVEESKAYDPSTVAVSR